MKKEFNKGFTLIELIVVMVLLGILAAVAIPRISNSITDAEENSEAKFIADLKSALELYAADNFVDNSVLQYPDNPFDALKQVPPGWSYMLNTIRHTRNNDTYKYWHYYESDPGSCTEDYEDGSVAIESGCYTLTGPHTVPAP